MSDRPIQVGDLVQVVRGCIPGANGALGGVFRVSLIFNDNIRCTLCDRVHEGAWALAEENYCVRHNRAPIAWLRRIPPLEELEGQRTEEKLRETA